ncbi:hypothetical protein Trydic_g23731 [Trypoxylus dichotomus]
MMTRKLYEFAFLNCFELVFKKKRKLLLERIVTCDETWVHNCTLESKYASTEWKRKGEINPVKVKTRFFARKMSAALFWDYRGILQVNFLHGHQPINATYYCGLLSNSQGVALPRQHKEVHSRFNSAESTDNVLENA